jgi:alkanesulfonate monooxygenase SsuD/methylene tetrahydromethanopterin reductase-like flavin-dependent oxidoreductase (luciferase family)
MKLSFLAAASYEGAVPNRAHWPVAPEGCDPAVASRSLNENLQLAARADELGFDWVSVSEHHFAPTMLTPNPLVWAGALTQVVKRAKIALLGPILPINNPVRVAEEVAMIDCLSGGRTVALFLRGTPFEWRVYSGEASDDTRGETQEGVDLILKAWTASEPFAWEGEHHHYGLVSVWPRPVQIPHPPVYGSGNSEESIVFAAQRKLGLAISFAQPERVAESVGLYRAEAEKAGWTPSADQVLYRGFAHVAESDAARDAEAEKLTHMRIPPSFTGGPKTVLGQVERLRDVGVGVVDMGFVPLGHQRAMASMDILGEAIAPVMQAW